MRRRQPISTLTDTPFPYATLFRAVGVRHRRHRHAGIAELVERRRRPGVLDGQHQLRPQREDRLGRELAHVADVRQLAGRRRIEARSEEHTYALQSLMRISYAVFCLTKTNMYVSKVIHHYLQN